MTNEERAALVAEGRALAEKWFEMCDDIHDPITRLTNEIEAQAKRIAGLKDALRKFDALFAYEYYGSREELEAEIEQARMEERAAIVAWLRKQQAATESLRDDLNRVTAGYHMADEHASALEQSADAIEAGKHHDQ